ncbi:MAG: o-succinylbenzoate synthase [Vulcanococcus sp.]
MAGADQLRLQWRPYRFALPQAMVTSQGAWRERLGWLLRLETADGRLGWGEAALQPEQRADLAAALEALPEAPGRADLEAALPQQPPPLACALGMALAELDGLGSSASGGWRPAPPSAFLLPAGEAALPALAEALQAAAAAGHAPSVKWKVAAVADALEQRLLEALLEALPASGRLRLDANGGWDRPTAQAWARRLATDPRLEWLEQPLPPADRSGLEALARQLPVALDESLRAPDGWRPGADWPGWQVRRPLLEGDPRPLLAALTAGIPRLMVSTALETGIGRRFLQHLAALQADGPTPTAPGLAPGWRPGGDLFAADPERVWGAAA